MRSKLQLLGEVPLFDGLPYPASCAAVEDSIVLFLPVEAFHRFVAREPALARNNQEIAARIGTVREIVSRTFSRMAHEGILRIDGREVTILDRDRLQDFRGRIQTGRL